MNDGTPGTSQWRLAWRRFGRRPTAMLGLGGLVIVVLVSLAAPLLAPYDPNQVGTTDPLLGPGAQHWFGSDDLGRDLLSRIVWGGRESLKAGGVGLSLAVGIGMVVGLISGFVGGRLDNWVQRSIDVLMAFPTILLLLSIVSILGPGLGTVMIALGISDSPTFARLVRGSVLGVKSRDFLSAAQAIGASNWRQMFKHILPNILPTLLVYATTSLGFAIMTTAGLSFIGLGAQPPSPEWGAMLNQGRNYIFNAWWMAVFPGLPIVWTVLCINLVGDGLRDALDPKA